MVTDRVVAMKFCQIWKSATDRGLEFNLSLVEVRRILNTKKCFFSGVELVNKEGHDSQLTFERVDNSKGYISGNVVACSKKMNSRKANLSIEDIVMFYNGFKKKKLINSK